MISAPEQSKQVIGPLVSVVIPTYNRAALLLRAIESARTQTYLNLEIIVVDDASTDTTATAVKRIADARIRYLRHSANRGGSAARNTGIEAATGEYIAFLDDDDEWEPEKTEIQLQALDGYNVVLCASDLDPSELRRNATKEAIDLEDLRRGRFTAGGTGVLMARTEILKQTMFDESLPRYQDWDVFIRIGMKCRIRFLNKPLVRYNKGGHLRITNSILRVPAAEMEKHYCMLLKHREFFGPKWFDRHMSRALLFGVKHRPNKLVHLVYAARNYGTANVVLVLGNRLWVMINRKLRRLLGGNTSRGYK